MYQSTRNGDQILKYNYYRSHSEQISEVCKSYMSDRILVLKNGNLFENLYELSFFSSMIKELTTFHDRFHKYKTRDG